MLPSLLLTFLLSARGQQPVLTGNYHGLKPSNPCAGCISDELTVTIVPPRLDRGQINDNANPVGRFWGQNTWQRGGWQLTADGNLAADALLLSYSGGPKSTIDFQPPSIANWVPWNRYWTYLGYGSNWESYTPDLGPKAGNALNEAQLSNVPVTMTSSPPCLFLGNVNKDGNEIILFVVQCAYNQNYWPSPTTGDIWSTGDSVMRIGIPWVFLAPQPFYPQFDVQTQATFLFFDAATNPLWTPVGPQAALMPYKITSPVLALSSLTLFAVLPGRLNGPYNTLANTKLEAITVVLQLGVQIQALDQLAVSFNQGPVNLLSTNNAALNAPGREFPPVEAGNQRNLILMDTSTVTGTPPFLVVGPGCSSRLGSVNCCSQSTAQVVKPAVSTMTYPFWLTTLVITLGPPGCVIPDNRRFSFEIPSFYAGYNPSVLVINQLNVNNVNTNPRGPGFQIIDTFAWTNAEPGRSWNTRYSDISPIAWYTGWQGVTLLSTPGNPNTNQNLVMLNEAPALPTSLRARGVDINIAGIMSSWVVGLSTLNAVQISIDTALAGVQPHALTMRLTIQTPWAVPTIPNNVNGGNAAGMWTPYWIVITGNQGIFRSNVGSIEKPIPLTGVQEPAACQNALLAMTTATGTVLVRVDDVGCIRSLGTTNTVIVLNLNEAFLLPNMPAGSQARFDVRIISPMWTVDAFNGAVANPPVQLAANDLGGQLVVGDTAAVMNVLGYTTTADCRTMTYQPSAVNDIAALSIASRCQLVAAIAWISPVTTGFLPCNPGANVNNAQNQITYVKFGETYWAPKNWPYTNLPPPASEWPQNVGLAGTPAVTMRAWGIMFSRVMFAVVVSYPPTLQNLQSLGAKPVVPSGWQLAFLIKMDRITSACSTPNEPNPWSFCVDTSVQAVLFFPANPVNPAGTYLEGWGARGTGVCVTVPADGAVAGWRATTISPTGDDSDGAWYAFFAFFALPLLLLCCCLLALLYFLKKRKPKGCCPADSGYPVQEMYWVNAPAAGQMYMQPAMPSPVTSAGAPIFMVQ